MKPRELVAWTLVAFFAAFSVATLVRLKWPSDHDIGSGLSGEIIDVKYDTPPEPQSLDSDGDPTKGDKPEK